MAILATMMLLTKIRSRHIISLMKGMKQKIYVLSVVLLFFPMVSGFSQDTGKNVDFSITLKDLVLGNHDAYTAANSPYFVISGIISSITIINNGENDFSAEIRIVDGEWVNLTEIKMYDAILRVQGSRFFGRIPEKGKAISVENGIHVNQTVLVLGKCIGYTKGNGSGLEIPIIQTVDIRVMHN